MTLDELSLMRRAEVLRVCGFSKSTLYQLIDREQFPEPVQIGPRSVRWRKSDVVGWLAARPLASEVKDLGKQM